VFIQVGLASAVQSEIKLVLVKSPEVLGVETQELTESQPSHSPVTDLLAQKQQKLDQKVSFYQSLEGKYKKLKEKETKITRLVSYLKRQGSPVATYGYAKQIIDTAEANGADYRIVVAIMGVESGFCRVNVLKYNCFGYLNKVQYSGYSEAFSKLVPRISREYAKPYGTNFKALAKAYGMINFEYHSGRLATFYNAL
jgi:hypothetical protein